ncbi:MAG: GerMN domain-containing protein [Candidatus Nanopelagicales bacterium]
MLNKFFLISLSLLISACGNIPTSSSVNIGPEFGSNDQNSIIRVIASRPQPGMSQEQIITGFLNASASSVNDYAIAREYLVPSKKNSWNPTKSIEVYEGQGQFEFINENQIDFSAALHSQVNESSRIVFANPEDQLLKTFKLEKVDDQWRINIDFDGLVISKTDLDRSFSFYPLWFVDPTKTFLVPESVILPKAITANATRLMQLLLLGPSEQINNTVITAFPKGSSLSIDSVPITNGVASVSLNETVLKAASLERQLLASQIVKTLTRIPEVKSIQIKVGTQNLSILNAPLNQTASTWDKFYSDSNYSNVAYFISENKLWKNNAETKSLTGKTEIDSKLWSYGTSNRSENLYALVDETKTNLIINSYSPEFKETIFSSSNIGNPKIDVLDTIWVTLNNQVSVFSSDKKLNLIAQNFAIEDIAEIIPAPDASRVLLIIRSVYGTELRLANVIRNPDTIVLTNIRKIMRDGFSITKAVWQDETNILYLDSGSQPVNVYSLDISTGASRNIYSINGVQDIASRSGQVTMLEINDGTILQRVTGEWKVISNSQSPNYPN